LKVLIVEDDPWIAELFSLVIRDLDDSAEVALFASVVAAQNHLRDMTPDLLIADLNLPDGKGLEVARTLARKAPASRRLLTTANISRQTVKDARAAGITEIIAKPFKLDNLRDRLARLLSTEQSAAAETTSIGDLPSFLNARLQGPLRLAWSSPARQQQAAASAAQLNRAGFIELAEAEPLLTVVALNRANRQLERGRETCLSPEDAWERLGQSACRELVQRLAQARIALEHPLLQQLASDLSEQQQRLGEALTRLGADRTIPTGALRTTVTCSRLGELAVISAIQHFLNYGQQADEASMRALINQHASAFGNSIKIQQQLPFLLRELTGALFHLPATGLRKDRILLRIAALETGFASPAPAQLEQLRRLIKLGDATPVNSQPAGV
jgi:DNA-binding response OmpR family regulator|tara:strand:+ start:2483 stop:3640 length:1158 start_codon:yes stop_codon:yes gene_type:complete